MITRIALADDHEIFLEGLKSLLVQQSNLEIVGLARSGRGLLEVVSKTRPHVVLLDLMMPRLNGIETARRIAAAERD
jgi:DNA-binding NarL/FixJ family response regulator